MFEAGTEPKEQDNDETLIIDSDAENDGNDDGEITREDLLKMDRPKPDEAEGEDGGDTEGDESADGGGDDGEEFEITLDGDDGSHPKQDANRGFRKRINKLNAKAEAAKESQTEAEAALEVERERNRLLQLALDQQSGEAPRSDGALPNPDDFDGGVADPKFIEALQDHVETRAVAKIQETQTQARTAQDAQGKLYDQQVEHYKRAEKLKVPDYDDTEDKALAALGQDVVNQFIANSDKSEIVLYWLGKNPTEAERLKGVIDSNPVKGVLELGRLEAKLNARPKSKGKPAPDPDRGQRGGGAGQKKAQRGPKGATFA